MSKPEVPQAAPYPVDVKTGRTYWWCACGRSRRQPFCDGSHTGTSFTPTEYRAEKDKTIFFCGCKNTKREPVCDGSHNNM